MPAILIVADDLTGALDSAVGFAGGGRRVVVARRTDRIGEALSLEPDVLAVNTATREGSEDDAVAVIEGLAARLPLAEVRLILKKVDSRLKGHVRAETDALARVARRERVVAVPAIPAMGRVQNGGSLVGEGIDQAIEMAPFFAPEVETPDAESDAALDEIVAGDAAGTLWVGARGLAFALARAMFGPAAGTPPELSLPMTFAIGSRDPITRAQLDALDLSTVIAPDGRVPEGRGAALDIVAMSDGGAGRPAADAGADFAAGIALRLEESRSSALLASGGETADAILERLGVGCLEVLAEVAPGLPVSTASLPWGQMRIVTKSGGFGAPDLLRRIAAGAGAGDGGDRGP